MIRLAIFLPSRRRERFFEPSLKALKRLLTIQQVISWDTSFGSHEPTFWGMKTDLAARRVGVRQNSSRDVLF
jgi:hypothetical protein